ncbi:DUF4123 domain-containing protein [Aquipseudomonas ullengensis]|uniref:DUF4123 domain-containing protein n=1 Tax=Aquipseudomonas ullengensis TaxID=2759166 RepID=A0A7W4Q8X1_9GAMM|nr:DUF4123 domain-containing protein [Pseudomonas ullengensis]MBB2494207.1 DUF4123 domain-containing protein [Pseudomonas ullengensis]
MRSEPKNLRDWLNQQDLGADRHLYVVIGNASDANPLQAYYQQHSIIAPLPIWGGTPYEGWHDVMPYLGELGSNSSFLDWAESESLQDWGWLATSPYSPEVVLDHLRSLTQARMPDGTEVFFRHWDGRHLLPILQHLGSSATGLLPVFDHYLINGTALAISLPPLPAARKYPWWEVPKAMMDALTAADPSTVIDNLMQWLQEEHAELYFTAPERNLRQKVERFVRRTALTEDNYTGRLIAHLEDEATQ